MDGTRVNILYARLASIDSSVACELEFPQDLFGDKETPPVPLNSLVTKGAVQENSIQLRRQYIENLSCSSCGEPPEAHMYSYTHRNENLIVLVRHLLPKYCLPSESEGKIWMWTRCLRLGSKVAMFQYSSVEIYNACKPQPTLEIHNPDMHKDAPSYNASERRETGKGEKRRIEGHWCPLTHRPRLGAYGITAVIIGAIGYLFIRWKGWKLSDMMFVTKRGLSDACNVVGKQVDQVSESVNYDSIHDICTPVVSIYMALLTSELENVDAASLAVAIMKKGLQSRIFLGCDNKPLSRQEIMDVVNNSGKFDTKFGGFTGTDGPLGKRMENSKTRAEIGWEPKYPSFTEFLGISS
ncbi:1-phosphatidylinositol-3-phosphate 5-kinase FAB1B [Zea mays]|uniref:1-phosphatidylinositol-3-phosphate 5-kinase FAB1B n=1 Tax=Zea mays TaxID=4577 RepID=A0A317YCU5_MAIZE|nr:1-phosphatidylinositol-3-phosphate 5-kinase FAB1B [Zea mays]